MFYPRVGWCEVNTQTLVDNCLLTAHDAIAKSGINPADIASVSFSYMRVGMVTRGKDSNFNRENTIMWFDARAIPYGYKDIARIEKAGMSQKEIYDLRGFTAGGAGPIAKLRWIKDNEPKVYESTGKIHNIHSLMLKAFGVDDVIDPAGDSGWFGFTNLETMDYDDRLISVLDCEEFKPLLPKLQKTGTLAGQVSRQAAEKSLIPEGTPIFVGNGDHQCGALGLGVIQEDQVYMCIGTTGTISRVAYHPLRHPSLTCSVLGSNAGGWQMDANSPMACGCFKWFRDTFCQEEILMAGQTGIDVYDLMTAQAAKAQPGCNNMIFLPWPTGASGCPHYDTNARMTFVGMTQSHGKAEMIRSVMEGVCYENRDMLNDLDKADLPAYESLRFTGGGARSKMWCQMHADILGKPVETVAAKEAVACGAAMNGAVGCGFFKNFEEAVENMVRITGRYEPNPKVKDAYDESFEIYKMIYDDLKNNTFPAIAKAQAK